MTTVLIIGASGFIGRHLTGHLASVGCCVHVVNRRTTNMTDREHLWDGADSGRFLEIVESAKPSVVIHLAARAKPCRDLRNIAAQYENTTKPALCVAQSLPNNLDLALFFGSCEEYGAGSSPADEDQFLSCVSPYGWAKLSAFHGVTMTARQRSVPWCWVRPYLVFGPGQKGDGLIPDVISRCIRGQDVLLTPGQQTRDLLYIDDLCRMVASIVKTPKPAVGQVFNLCTGRPQKVADIAQLIQRLAGRGNIRLGALPYRDREIMELYGSPGKFNSRFGEAQFTELDSALANTIDVFRREIGF